MKSKELKRLRQALKEVKEEAAQNLAGWQRERADFQNYKKKEEERKAEFFRIAKEDLILKVLKIVDLLEEAFQHLPDFSDQPSKDWAKGINHIYNELKKMLEEEGVLEIKALGKRFDPQIHEAVKRVNPALLHSKKRGAKSEKKSEIVVKEVKKGYTLNGRLLRPAKVVVSSKG